MKRTKTSLLKSALALLLCVSMLIGSTFAWFTDSVTSKGNIIQSGNLDIEMYWTDDLSSGNWYNVEEDAHNTIFSYDNWEPGYTDVKYIKLVNKGNLAMNYKLTLTPQGSVGKLAEVINVFFADQAVDVQSREDLSKLGAIGLLNNVLNGGATANGTLLAKDQYSPLHPSGEVIMTIAMNMITTAGNEYQEKDSGEFTITALATQASFEKDSFGSDYDSNAEYPTIITGGTVTTQVNAVDGKVPAGGVTMTGNGISAFVPGGIEMAAGADALTLSVTPMEHTTTDITVVNNEILIPVDVHISGIAAGNTTPIVIDLGEVLPKYMNMGNYHLYHVENGGNSVMTLVDNEADLTQHNRFTYDPLTGAVKVAMASFSEVALVADTTAAWEGNYDYSWYTNAVAPVDGESAPDYTIANADQLAAFGAIVGGMNGQTQDSFTGKTVKLLADINLADGEKSNNNVSKIFYPVGYYYTNDKNADGTTGDYYSTVKSFEGTLDGNGHTISNFYQNTWEIKGDYDGNYYSDAMGLFGYVVNGTVKNLTVDNFSSDGEFTPTGVIAAYAVNSTFENIAITNCEPRVYNTGNGGIVGIGGNSDDPDTYKLTFKNITIDNSNIITALWGSYDVACGGLVGMFRGAGHVYMSNCHVAAQMNVYNDVCGNYQYYWYRYSGMMVGTNKNMITDKDGYTVPETSKFHAENCTVHFGEWNDYYYCEFEKNGHPSYSGPDDYKFSRVSLEDLTWDDKNSNKLIDDDERESVKCKHDHTDAENNQAIYLPFNQLFTGYGWGVKHIPVYNGKDYAFEGITILDREEAYSVKKFDYIGGNTLNNNKEYTIGELFKEATIADKNMFIKHENVQVTVSPVESSTVSGQYAGDITDWTKGTLTFTGSGSAIITITDYYFCQTTTVVVSINDRKNETKFETKFTGDFLYRVGNENTVSLGSLFKHADGTDTIKSTSVSVTIEKLEGNATGSFNANTADWTKGTIQFTGTGVVAVTITDKYYCNYTVLNLEVVDATNLTSATGTTTGGNFVLLCDVNTTTYVNYWNCTLYGNGFTYSLKGAPTAYNSKQGHGIIITKNATLDNVVFLGDVYNSYGAYTNQDYYNTVIDVIGETTIQNCYIANCAAPVKARQADVIIKNSTLYGGAVANLLIVSGTATLENVTTANYDDGRAVVGMGIVIHSDATESAKLVLNGTLTQYNFISENKVPTDTYAKNLHDAMFNDDCSQYQFGNSSNRYVNTGIISLTSTFNGEDITDNAKTGYIGKALRVSSYDGYVYTQPNTSGSVNNNCPEYKPTTQGTVPPSFSFDYTNKNYVAKVDGSNDYCYEENGKVNISMDQGDTFNWDTSILTIGKGITSYTVSMNGTNYTGKNITFNTAGDYEVSYTYTDDNNYKLDENGNITTYSVTYTKKVSITVAVVKATTKHAEFTFGSSNTASTTVTVGNNTYVMPNVSGTSSTIGSTTVNGQTIYYPIVEIIMSDGKTSHSSGWYAYFPVFSGAVTITDYADNGTGDKMTPYNGSTTTMPSGLSVVGDPTQLFKYQSGSTAGSTPVVKNSKLVYSSAKIEAKRSEYSTVIQYSYTDNAGATYYYYIGYHAPAQSYTSCVTPDMLVTLADGTQVRVDRLKGNEELLVWNHETGKLDKAPVAYIVDHEGVVSEREIIHLTFANGKTVKIIGEHVFFDATQNKYVSINSENADELIGHSFAALSTGGTTVEKVELIGVERTVEETLTYEVVSYKHLTCFTEGILSTSAFLDPLLNVFDVDVDTLAYSLEDVQKDIETYGLYTYADFDGLISEEAFELYNAQYLKIAVGKGYITWDDILELIDIYFNVDVKPIQ